MTNRYFINCTVLLIVILSMVISGLSSCSGKSPEIKTDLTTTPSETATTSTDIPVSTISAVPQTVLSISGNNVLVLKSGQSEWISGEAGMALTSGDLIKTESESKATITFFDGSIIELDSDTVIILEKLDNTNVKTTIRLKQELGKTVSRVQKIVDTESSYEIETEAAVAAVRGTTLFVGVDPDGTTTVGTIEGSVSVIAEGVEIKLPEGTYNITPVGQPPGDPQQGTLPTTSLTTTTETINPEITFNQLADRQEAYPGDTVNFTYTVSNTGDVPLAKITFDSISYPVYQEGDKNSDNVLGVGETWTYYMAYTIKDGDIGHFFNTAMVSGTSPDNQVVTASSESSINILDIIVEITSIQAGDQTGQYITVAGTVNDPSIPKVIIAVNGTPVNVPVVNGIFSTDVTLEIGITTTITVTITKPGDITRSASITLVPETQR